MVKSQFCQGKATRFGWKDNRVSLFTYTSDEEGGTAWFDDFTYDTDGNFFLSSM